MEVFQLVALAPGLQHKVLLCCVDVMSRIVTRTRRTYQAWHRNTFDFGMTGGTQIPNFELEPFPSTKIMYERLLTFPPCFFRHHFRYLHWKSGEKHNRASSRFVAVHISNRSERRRLSAISPANLEAYRERGHRGRRRTRLPLIFRSSQPHLSLCNRDISPR